MPNKKLRSLAIVTPKKSTSQHSWWRGALHQSGSDRGSPNQGSTLLSKRVRSADTIAAKREDDESGPAADAVRVAQVRSERRLPR